MVVGKDVKYPVTGAFGRSGIGISGCRIRLTPTASSPSQSGCGLGHQKPRVPVLTAAIRLSLPWWVASPTRRVKSTGRSRSMASQRPSLACNKMRTW